MRRAQLMPLAIALLYLGPFVAGLSRAGAGILPVFVAAFFLWLLLMRPGLAGNAEGGAGRALATLAGSALVQVVLVLLVYGLGRGLSVLTGGPAAVPLWLAAALSLTALPLARIALPSGAGDAEMDRFLDDALRDIEGLAARDPAEAPPEDAADGTALTRLILDGLAADIAAGRAGAEEVDEALMALEALPDHRDLLAELEARRGDGPVWRMAFLRCIGHPYTILPGLSPETVVDWLADGLASDDADHAGEALMAAHGWLDKAAPGDAAGRLRAAAEAWLARETAPDLRASLQRLIADLAGSA